MNYFDLIEHRRILCATPCQLNGRPARIRGASAPFARLEDTETGLGADWAWGAVERVMAAGGQFLS